MKTKTVLLSTLRLGIYCQKYNQNLARLRTSLNLITLGHSFIFFVPDKFLRFVNFCFLCLCVFYSKDSLIPWLIVLPQPSGHQGAVLPDKDATFELFDRVVNVKLNVAVPFGLRGTIIGIHEGRSSFVGGFSVLRLFCKLYSLIPSRIFVLLAPNSSDVLYEVIFDEPFLGGLALR